MPEDIKVEIVQKTQKTLGKYVKKPVLTEKLLKKPPFRFLHDVVKAVIKETGFLKGLYTDAELNSENVQEKDAKVAFLSKLIDAVKVITSTELSVKPSKVIAGLEPADTNLLLQTIAKAIDKKLDSSEYVKRFQSGKIIPTAENKKKLRKDDKKIKKPVIKKDEKEVEKEKKLETPSSETPKSTDRNKTRKKPSPRDLKAKTKEKNDLSVQKSPKNERETQAEPVPTEEIVIHAEGEPRETIEVVESVKRSTSANRPKSARPLSGSGNVRKRPPPVENEPVESISNLNQTPNRPKSSLLRPPSVRPSSARPGAPRLRPDSSLPLEDPVMLGKINVIVENFDKEIKDGDDEETVVIQSTASPDLNETIGSDAEIANKNNKGHLVEQILEQINDEGVGTKSNIEIDWQQDGVMKESVSKDANHLRSLIQTLTKTANPLGKLLNYLHEDIDAMHTELETWTNTKKQLFGEIAKQKKISAELNKPLLQQLEGLGRDITKIEEAIMTSRGNILRNDIRIKELLSK